MIKIKTLSLRNFLSIGQVTQTIDFDRQDLTLILGENLDLGGEGARNGTGKAQPLTSKILTESGWTLMKDIQVGDRVIAHDGQSSTVLGIYPQGKIPVYRLTFKDGRTCEASEEHLWNIYSHQFRNKNDKNHTRILTTKEIGDLLDSNRNKKSKQLHYLYVPLFTPTESLDSVVSIAPYTLGAMIGDGNLRSSPGITSCDSEIVSRVDKELQLINCSLKQVHTTTREKISYRVVMNEKQHHPKKILHPFRKYIADLNLNVNSEDKFIPNQYKNISVRQKIELLQGLLDTDGTVDRTGSISYCTTSKQLALDVADLVRSIGGLARITEKAPRFSYLGEVRQGKTAYIVRIRYHNPRDLFYLNRKKNKISESYQYKNQLRLQITAIDRIEDSECQCIYIDHPDHLYVTDNYVVTHNTSIIQGLSYALFGTAINNIRKDNLINRTNQKNMLSTVEFEVNGVDYKIIRGRKPNVLKFFINNQEQQIVDDSQGDSRETQEQIERLLQMEPEMFKQIIALNTYNEPFLALRAADQRKIIEQLLGITLLSERAEKIKELNKQTRDNIQSEQYRIKGLEEANRRIVEQIDNLKKRQRLWTATRDQDVMNLTEELTALTKIDIDQEIISHRELETYNNKRSEIANITARYTSTCATLDSKHVRSVAAIKKDIKSQLDIITSLESIVIEQEVENHRLLQTWNDNNKTLIEAKKWRDSARKHMTELNNNRHKLEAEIAKLENHQCYACGQALHDDQHETILRGKHKQLQEVSLSYLSAESQFLEHDGHIKSLGKLGTAPRVHYESLELALGHKNKLDTARTKHLELVQYLETTISEYETERTNTDKQHAQDLAAVGELGQVPRVHYDTLELALKHQSQVTKLADDLERRLADQDPYHEQIEDMEQNAVQTVDYEEINRLNRVLQHQDFLLDLLTNKRSFVRKRIIEQNLSYLNNRLTHYLDKMGLPHQVVFQNDLTVEITELGRDLDFDNLSRGERTRLIIGLSFAFRDVWESLYAPINVLFVDELIDNGLDTAGVESSIALLKDMTRRRSKSIWLVSHRDELSSRVSSILRVVKEGGYSSYHCAEE
jgi:hypothetical protein